MSEGYKISEINFQNKRDSTDCFLIAALSLLLSCDHFCRSLLAFPLPCKNPPHYCLACGLKSLVKASFSTKSVDISKLRLELSKVTEGKEIFQLDTQSKAMEVLTLLLSSLHCIALNDPSQDFSEEILSKSCKKSCPAHCNFFLNVKETYTCECGETFKTKWGYSNYCQYLNVREVLDGAEDNLSTDLLSVPGFMLKSFGEETNTVRLQGIMMQTLSEKLSISEAKACGNEYCEVAKSKITFELKKTPRYYMMNPVWDYEDSRHIDVFLATVSISICMSLKDVYGNSSVVPYNIKGIMFYGRDRYEYACRYGLEWTFNGLGPGCGWYELLKEITIMRYRPICILYEESNEIFSLEMEDVQLKKLEKLACECDAYQTRFNKEVFGGEQENSRLFLKGKTHANSIVIGGHEYLGNGGGREVYTKSLNYSEVPSVGRGTREEVKKEINFEQKIGNPSIIIANPSIKNEVKITDMSKNEEYKQFPKEFPTPNDPNYNNLLQINPRETRVKPDATTPKRNYNFDNKTISPDPLQAIPSTQLPIVQAKPPSPPAAEKVKPTTWVCECEYSNQLDWEVCQKCKNLQPGLSGWVCKGCTMRNLNDRSRRCEACQLSRSSEPIIVENWKCNSCASFNVGTRMHCSNCGGKRKDSAREDKEADRVAQDEVEDDPYSDWTCQGCGQINKYYYRDKCSNCRKGKKTEASKPTEVKSNTWVCKCKKVNENTSNFCISCHDSRKIGEITKISGSDDGSTTWLCKCKQVNQESSKLCVGCYNPRRNAEAINNPEKIDTRIKIEERKNQKTDPVNQEWACKACTKVNFYFSTYCTKCLVPRSKDGQIKPTIDIEEKKDLAEDSINKNWTCKQCKKLNFHPSASCTRCLESRSKEPLMPKSSIRCSICLTDNSEGSKVCYFCKRSLDEPQELWTCWNCSKENELSMSTCVYCDSQKERPKGEDPPALVTRRWVCVCGKSNSLATRRCIGCDQVKSEAKAPAVQPAVSVCSECKVQLKIIDCPSCKATVRMAETCSRCNTSIKGVKMCSRCVATIVGAQATKSCYICGRVNRPTALKCASCSRPLR